jgi:biotin-(acetyl-CoA carboxylase) ligase
VTAPGPSFPPLLAGERVAASADPMAAAAAACAAGVDAGTVFWAERDDALGAAIALAPEVPLAESLQMVMVAANGLSDALGALAPPEVAVTWDWPDRLRVNGARCGTLTAAADARDPEAAPGWLAIGLTVQFAPLLGPEEAEPGDAPGVTALWEEGCVGLAPVTLLESWSRHMLVWINTWLEDGFRPVHDAWIGRAERRGGAVDFHYAGARRRGRFLGLDDQGAMLLQSADGAEILPLTGMLDHPAPWPPTTETDR